MTAVAARGVPEQGSQVALQTTTAGPALRTQHAAQLYTKSNKSTVSPAVGSTCIAQQTKKFQEIIVFSRSATGHAYIQGVRKQYKRTLEKCNQRSITRVILLLFMHRLYVSV